jgi:O-antigen biosynthesis protein
MIELPVNSSTPEVSVLVVTYGGWEWTERALRSLREHTGVGYEVVIVDNDSPDDTPIRLRREVRGARVVLNESNEGFGPANNAAAELARGEVLVLLNPDALVRPGWLPPLLETLGDPGVGAVVPRLLNLDGTVQEAGSLVWAEGSTEAVGAGAPADDTVHRFRRTTDYGSAACLAIRRDTFLAVGGFHPGYVPAYCEDVDLALSLRARGLSTVVDPRSDVVHVRFGAVGEGTAARLIRQNRKLLMERWGHELADRPPPFRADRPHRLWAGRDREAVERFLVIAETPDRLLLMGLVRAQPMSRVTSLSRSGAGTPQLLDAGIEDVRFPDDLGGWLRDRRFHYSAVVVVGSRPEGLGALLEDSQPQAEVIETSAQADPGRVLSLLERSGIFPEPYEVV